MKKSLIISLVAVSIGYSQYSLNVKRIGGAKSAGEENFFLAQLMKNGSVVRTFERPLPFDVPFPATYVNERSGTVVLSYIFDGFVEVYNGHGEKEWEHHFFKEIGPNYERTITVALGEKSIAFLTSDVTLQNAKVHLFAINGAKYWETDLPFSMGYEIVMSADEKTIVAGSYALIEETVGQTSSILDEDGYSKGSADILFRRAAFSDDNSLVALASEKEIVTLVCTTAAELGRAVKNTEGIITDLIWDGNSVIAQESEVITDDRQQFFYIQPIIRRFSSGLHVLSEQNVQTSPFKSSSLVSVNGGVELHVNGEIFPIKK